MPRCAASLIAVLSPAVKRSKGLFPDTIVLSKLAIALARFPGVMAPSGGKAALKSLE